MMVAGFLSPGLRQIHPSALSEIYLVKTGQKKGEYNDNKRKSIKAPRRMER